MTKWPIAQLGDIATIQSGGTPSRSVREYWDGDIPWIKISDLTSTYVTASEERITTPGLENSSAKVFPKGTILLTIFATIGKVAILDIAAATNQAIAGITPRSNSYGKFLYYALVHYSNDLLVQGKGVAQKNINLSILKKLHLPLPTISEQKLIAAKLDKLFDHLHRIRERLDKIPALLKQFRQAVLTQAFTGQLTDDWVRKNNVTPVDQMLLHITAPPKPSRYNSRTSNVIPGRYALSVGPPHIRIPNRYKWVELVSVARLETGHTPSRKHPEYWKGGDIPWIGIKDASEHHSKTIYSTYQKTNELGLANSAARLLPANTVCLSRTASLGYVVKMGRPMATSQDFVNWVCSEAVDPDWLRWLLVAEEDSIWSFGKGTTHKTVYFPEVIAFHIALAPIEEQQEIARRVESLFAIADKIEKHCGALKQKIEQLPQAVLRKAFRGELVKGQVKAHEMELDGIQGMMAAEPNGGRK